MTTSQRPSAEGGKASAPDPNQSAGDTPVPGYGQPQTPLVFGLPPQPVIPPTAGSSRGLGIVATCLGLVGLLFGAFTYTGIFAFVLGVAGIVGIVGLVRAPHRTGAHTHTAIAGSVLSAGAVALGVWGVVSLLQTLTLPVSAPATVDATAAGSGGAAQAPVARPAPSAGGTPFLLEVSSTTGSATVLYGSGTMNGGAMSPIPAPWSKTVTSADTGQNYAHVTASITGSGSVTCTITNTDSGQVLDTKTSESDGSQFASAIATCSSLG